MFVLDTKTCIYIMNNRPASVRKKFERISLSERVPDLNLENWL